MKIKNLPAQFKTFRLPILLLLFGLLFCSTCPTCEAIPTTIVVRVKSKDAKFIGSSMGGALVKIKNKDTGEILAIGYTEGTTGNTKTIMSGPISRGQTISDDASAKFTTTLNIEKPTFVEVSAYGPVAQRQSANSVSLTQWIVPGRHIMMGDALVLEIPGFVVDVLSPPTHLKLNGAPQVVPIRANVTMMCGCPIKPNGIWDANKFDITAILQKDGEKLEEIKLTYSGETSQFSASYTALDSGTYTVLVYAFDESNGNTGLDRTTFLIQ